MEQAFSFIMFSSDYVCFYIDSAVVSHWNQKKNATQARENLTFKTPPHFEPEFLPKTKTGLQ